LYCIYIHELQHQIREINVSWRKAKTKTYYALLFRSKFPNYRSFRLFKCIVSKYVSRCIENACYVSRKDKQPIIYNRCLRKFSGLIPTIQNMLTDKILLPQNPKEYIHELQRQTETQYFFWRKAETKPYFV